LALANFLAIEASPGTVEGLNNAGGAFAVICAAFAFWGGAEGLMLKKNTMMTGLPLGGISRFGRLRKRKEERSSV
jgi:hypothetical protein